MQNRVIRLRAERDELGEAGDSHARLEFDWASLY
jgi:hypothetical protein